MTSDSARLAPGDVVADVYEIRGELGSGAMGRVYEAVHAGLRRPVALKVLHPEHATRPEARRRFSREARLAASLSHRHAVEIYDFGADGGLLWIAMERLDGFSLREAIDAARAPTGLERLLNVAESIGDLLAAAAALGLVHRDLKPENVFLEPRQGGPERVVVLDFGLAELAARGGRPLMTRDGEFLGTPSSMAPEQIRGERVGTPTDVYGLGCTLYELATGRPVFDEPTDFDVAARHLYQRPRPISVFRPEREVPLAFERLVEQMLSKDPGDRPGPRAIVSAVERIRESSRHPERSSGAEAHLRRQSRMVRPARLGQDRATLKGRPALSSRPGRARVAMIGDIGEDLWVALATNSLEPFLPSDADPIEEADVIFAPGIGPTRVAELSRWGAPVITDADPGDFDRIGALLEQGAFDAVPRPLRADTLVLKLVRAIGRNGRGGR